jgi:hypothetical protein
MPNSTAHFHILTIVGFSCLPWTTISIIYLVSQYLIILNDTITCLSLLKLLHVSNAWFFQTMSIKCWAFNITRQFIIYNLWYSHIISTWHAIYYVVKLCKCQLHTVSISLFFPSFWYIYLHHQALVKFIQAHRLRQRNSPHMHLTCFATLLLQWTPWQTQHIPKSDSA